MSLNSVVNRLVRAAASVPQDISDTDLDTHVAKLLAAEAKANDAKWAELGLGAYLNSAGSSGSGTNSPDPSLPKPNKRFLASVIRTVDGHNQALLRQQAQAASDARSERGERERDRRGEPSRRPAPSGASRLFGGALASMGRGGSRRSTPGSTSSRRGADDETAKREPLRAGGGQRGADRRQSGRQRRSGSGNEESDDERERDRRRDRDRDRGQRDDSDGNRRTSHRNRDHERERERERDGDRERRRDRERDRRSQDLSDSDDDRNRRRQNRDRHISDDDRHDRRRHRGKERARSTSRDREHDRERRREKDREHSRVKDKPRRASRSRSRSPRRRAPPPPSPPADSPPAAPPSPPVDRISRMDKYFQRNYDPRFDVDEVPKAGLVADVGWDSMLSVLKDRGKKRRRNSPTLSSSPEPEKRDRPLSRPVIGPSMASAASADTKALMEMEYTRQGGTREWDKGK